MALSLALGGMLQAQNALALNFAQVAQRARALAAEAYRAPRETLPEELQRLSYEDYRRIRFKAEKALWAGDGTAFRIGFFHVGMNYRQPVRIHEVTLDGTREILFDPAAFDYGGIAVPADKLQGLGLAGFVVSHSAGPGKPWREALAFQGASYFRSPGSAEVYGAWARGLAIDTGLAAGEEFPRFVEFWIHRPARSAQALTIVALLDSPRMTGAYRFTLTPGEETVQDVKLRLYARAGMEKPGIAPLTSMYFDGENMPPRDGDYRPEIHDSDGLSIRTRDDEWIWRPLLNPRRLLTTSFALEDPLGFGLLQRDRSFASYQDLDARRELRPGAWVEPKGRWGKGRVELVQIPNPDEFNNNIVAFWVPEQRPEPGKAYELEYRVRWLANGGERPKIAWVRQTRYGHGPVRGDAQDVWLRVDFSDPAFDPAQPQAAPSAAVAVDDNAELLETTLQPNPALGGWRLTLHLRRRDPARPVELRAQLRPPDEAGQDARRSETWSYILPPE